MTAQPFESYLSVVRQSGLVEADRLAVVVEELLAEHKSLVEKGDKPDSQILADRLISRELITAWQNDKLRQGVHKGFFLGKYKLLKHLGSGGMSNVFLGEHLLMRRMAALKVLPKSRVDDRSYLDRFLLEARAVAALDHPNIVKAYNVSNEGSTYYIVMEYVEGRDLEKIVQTEGVLPYEAVAEYIRQAADGLDHAHGRGLIHRDIKPSNLLLDREGVIKILDMGLAKITSNTRSLTIEHNEKVLGTADYLAPEQALDSSKVDFKADLYSLGCTMYFVLTGAPPFPSGSITQRLMKHQVEQPPAITDRRPDCPPELAAICEKLMAKAPADRYSSAGELSAVLAEFLAANGTPIASQRGGSARTPRGSGGSDVTLELRADDTAHGRMRASRNRKPLPDSGGVAVAAPAPRRPVPAKGDSSARAPALRTRPVETPVQVGPTIDTSASSSPKKPGSDVLDRASAPAPTGGLPVVWIGSSVMGLAAILVGAFFLVSNSATTNGPGAAKTVSVGSGAKRIDWAGFPIGPSHFMYFNVASAGEYQLRLVVKSCKQGAKAEVKINDQSIAKDLKVGESGSKSPQTFALAKSALKATDNKVEVVVTPLDPSTPFDFALEYEAAK